MRGFRPWQIQRIASLPCLGPGHRVVTPSARAVPVPALTNSRQSRGDGNSCPLFDFSDTSVCFEARPPRQRLAIRQYGAVPTAARGTQVAHCPTVMPSKDRVEVWLANGKKYTGQIVDVWPGHASAHGSLVLREDERVYVLIHRVHITRIQPIGPPLPESPVPSRPPVPA